MATQGEPYWLGRDVYASARLTFQHQCLLRRQGYLLHPTISRATASPEDHADGVVPEDISIADVGTGNGIWAADMCAHLASMGRAYTMTALDISDLQFPPKQTWPENCTFDVWNALSEVPENYLGKFDVVHARFLQAAFMNKPTAAAEHFVRNMAKLLKPGGWLQWQEVLPPISAEVDCHEDGTCSFRNEFVPPEATALKHNPGTQHPWMNQVADLVKGVTGFEEVESFYPGLKREFLRYENDLLIWTYAEILEGFRKGGVLKQEALDEISGVWETYMTDLKSGKKTIALHTSVTIGRKPIGQGA